MADKAFKWRKCGRDLLMDERAMRLSTLALHLRLIFEIVGHQDDSQTVAGEPAPGVGWMLDEYGDPYDTALIAALVHTSDVDAIGRALAELERARIVVKSDTNAWGAADHEERQLDPTTKRTRRARERSGNGSGTARERLGNGPGVPDAFPDRSADVPEPTEGRGQRTEFSPPPTAGGREEIPPSAVVPTRTPLATIGQRLALARELVAMSDREAATRSRIARGRYAQLEADEALVTRDELAQISGALGDPSIAGWPLPERSAELVEGVVRQHHALAIELGALDPATPHRVTAADVDAVYAAEPTDLAEGLALAEGWARVLTRAAEQLRRELAKGNARGREFFTLRSLAGKRRAPLLAAFDLDRRDDGQGARASPRRRGPAPPQNPDRLTDGEIPQ